MGKVISPKCIKTSIQPKQSNPLKKQTNNFQFNQFYNSKPSAIPPFGFRIKEAKQQINQNANNILLLPIFNLPPWTINKPHRDLTLKQQEKTHPTLPAKNKFNELRDKYSDHPTFYTDGSKTVDGTGASATNINKHKQNRLPNIASIYSAELQASKLALNMT